MAGFCIVTVNHVCDTDTQNPQELDNNLPANFRTPPRAQQKTQWRRLF